MLHLHEECIRMVFFNVLLFFSFRWNIRKIKKDFLYEIRRKWNSILLKSEKMFHFVNYLFRRKRCPSLLSFKYLMLSVVSQSHSPSV